MLIIVVRGGWALGGGKTKTVKGTWGGGRRALGCTEQS